MEIIDLSRELYHRTQYPGQPPIIHGVWKSHEEAFADSGNIKGTPCIIFQCLTMGGHTLMPQDILVLMERQLMNIHLKIVL